MFQGSTPTESVWHGSHKQSYFPPSVPFKVLKQPSLTILAPEKTCAEGEEQNHQVPCTNQDQALMVNFKQLYFLPKCCWWPLVILASTVTCSLPLSCPLVVIRRISVIKRVCLQLWHCTTCPLRLLLWVIFLLISAVSASLGPSLLLDDRICSGSDLTFKSVARSLSWQAFACPWAV